ncbi:MAG TPA: response regulator [Anaeromyxobacteraceae bacterium]|nr:response regulator [Anaeromyxobacteraceae bacterium]
MADLAAFLIRTGVLPPGPTARALAAARDGDLASAALRLGILSEAALARALADFHGCPAVDFSRSVVPTSNLDAIPAALCRQRRVLPVSLSPSELVLAMADPDDSALADEIRFVTGRAVLRYVAPAAAIERTVDDIVRAKARGALVWRGEQAPALPDPRAAWVGVVHGSKALEEGIDLPEITSTMEIVGVADALERSQFSEPSPARRERSREYPLAAPPPPAPPEDPGEVTVMVQGAGAAKLALVADSAQDAREEAAGLLSSVGATVLQATNGRAALDVIRDARPDLVLVEAMLPMMPGFEVCRAVKGDPVLRPTVVVLTSALHRGTVAADAKAAFGADAFFEKPYRHDEVLRSLKLLLLGPAGDAVGQALRAAAERTWREGAGLVRAGRIEEGTALLREAVAQDDLCAEAHYYLGHALTRQGLLFEAAASFARAAELRPDVDAAHQVLAQTYEQLGFQKSAREAWARAIEACRDEKRKGEMQVRLMRLLGM